jgi:hypothetical protein
MPGLIFRETRRYQYLLVRSEGRWVSLHLCRFFVVYVIFMLFCYIYHFFVMQEYLMDMCSLCADVGPVKPADYVRNRHRPRPGDTPTAAGGLAVAGYLLAGEAERVLRWVEGNFIVLTRTVPMAEIEDLPPSMQPHVVGAPQTCVWLFPRLANAVDQYNRVHRP